MTINQMANVIIIYCEIVENILQNELHMLKVSAQWLPCLKTPDQKHTRMTTSWENLTLFETDPAGFLECFLTEDQCWAHHFEPVTMRQFMQWKTAFFTSSKEG